MVDKQGYLFHVVFVQKFDRKSQVVFYKYALVKTQACGRWLQFDFLPKNMEHYQRGLNDRYELLLTNLQVFSELAMPLHIAKEKKCRGLIQLRPIVLLEVCIKLCTYF